VRADAERGILQRLQTHLEAGAPARREALDAEERKEIRSLNLLTIKPEMYVLNVDDEPARRDGAELDRVRKALLDRDPQASVVEVAAQLESEIIHLEPDERQEYLELLGVEESGLDRLVTAAYRLLGLHTFFTMNDNEARAWTLPVGATAVEAAGKVHTDFQERFIRAETVPWDELVEAGSLKAARAAGRLRAEGRDYVVQDGDLLLFRI
jgi:hypothetical protein